MPILITGANRGLGLELSRRLAQLGHDLICTGRDVVSLKKALSEHGVNAHAEEVGFADREELLSFMRFLRTVNLKHIVHVASPFEGTLRGSAEVELEEWTNFQFAAHLLAKHVLEHLPADGRVIFVGPVAGTLERMSDQHTLYSVYKGGLRFLSVAVRREGGLAHYINLGSFRDDGDGRKAVPTARVVERICSVLSSKCDADTVINIIAEEEAARDRRTSS